MGDHANRFYLKQLVVNPELDIVYVRNQDNLKDRIDAIHLRACIKQPACELRIICWILPECKIYSGAETRLNLPKLALTNFPLLNSP